MLHFIGFSKRQNKKESCAYIGVGLCNKVVDQCIHFSISILWPYDVISAKIGTALPFPPS